MVVDPDVKAEDLPARIREVDPHILIVRGKKVSADALKAGTALDAGDPRRRRHRHHRCRCRLGSRRLRLQLSRQELDRRRRAGARTVALDATAASPIRPPISGAASGNKGEYSKARGLYGRTLGIVGLGQIGREVAARARAFGMKVVGWSRSLTHEEADRLGITYAQTPLEVARLSDAVSVNVAATGDTKNLVNAEFLAAMRPGAYLINTARGSVVDEAALERAVREKGIRAALDVFQNEPAGSSGAFGNPIVQVPGVYGTHHVGASTEQAQVAIAHEVIRIVQAFGDTGEVPNVVNRLARSSATHVLTIRHRNRPGVLAHVFGVLAGADINVEEVENIIYHGAQATLARIHLDGAPNNGAIERIRGGNTDIISVELSEIDGKK